MKKTAGIFLLCMMVFTLAACGQSQESPASAGAESSSAAETFSRQETGTEAEETGNGTGNILIAYFSWSGNTEAVAGMIQEEMGGDLFEIAPAEPYTEDCDTLLEIAQTEQQEEARPELAAQVENWDSYDIIFVGYPNWWYGVPMALLSFLEQNDLSGKQVYLFCSHGTGGLANSVELITEAAPAAEISDNIFDCYEEEAASSEEEIRSWVGELGFGTDESSANTAEARRISVQAGDSRIVCELNDGTAADSLYVQLPLTVEVEDYSNNEKIFYPPQALDTGSSPLAQAGAGTLAYYEPWGMWYFFTAITMKIPLCLNWGRWYPGLN